MNIKKYLKPPVPDVTFVDVVFFFSDAISLPVTQALSRVWGYDQLVTSHGFFQWMIYVSIVN